MLGSSRIPGQPSSAPGSSSNYDSSRKLNSEIATPEIYKRFLVTTGVYALAGSIVAGTVGSIAFKSPMSRRFALGVGFGTGVGWGLKSMDDYIKYSEKKSFIPPFPKSSDEWIDKGILSFQKCKKIIFNAMNKKE
ncbi:hypothetical protein HWI79_2488 [Cryptosporidium felis]|nr:hypothetical protein HWI79_2488 [Cryptosporidium felis]